MVPPLCLDLKQRRYKFINNNGFVADPAALFKAARSETFWNEKEKEIFLEKLLCYGKNFEIIATFLEKKVRIILYFRADIFDWIQKQTQKNELLAKSKYR